jgi:hypothetical protein
MCQCEDKGHDKFFYQSKTVLFAIINAAVPFFYPKASKWIAENAEMYAFFLSMTALLLRALTRDAVKWLIK